jgi:DNA recombination protein RmuC
MDLLLTFVLAAAVGAVATLVASVVTAQRFRGRLQGLQTAAAVGEEKLAAAAAELARARADAAGREAAHQDGLEKERGLTESARAAAAAAEARAAALGAELAASEKNLRDQKALLDDANTRLTQAFAAVSREALEKSNAAFLQMAEEKFKTLSTGAIGDLNERKAQIATLLKPLEETLTTYQKRLAELEAQRTGAYAELRQQIGAMSATQAALSTQTSHLVSALTRPHVRGQWGEIALRKLVELAGMTARCDFAEQTTVTAADGEGGKLRPDMVVHLPAYRRVVVDCKAVLGAFLDAAGAADDGARAQHLRRHSELVRARAKDLASKAYWSQFDNTPEFVVLFLPGEAFLYAACEHDPSLLEDCIANKVIVATPTTLIALLKSIEYGWRQQAISENAEAIRKLGTEIYDRLATLADNMVKLGKSLDSAVDHYNKTVGSLESRLLVSARKIGELGARSDKELPETPGVDKRARELAATLHPDKSPLLPG